MKIGELDVSKIYLGDSEVEKIYLGTEQVFEDDSTPTPSTDVPLDNTFAVKYEGMWVEDDYPISNVEDIEMQLSSIGVPDPSEIEELSIGNQTTSIDLDGYNVNFGGCTGLTLAPSVTATENIRWFPAMKWVNVMGDSFEYYGGGEGLFQDMNCCPIYVPEGSLSDYQSAWENQTTRDCDGTVADRLIGWTSHDYSQDYLTIESIDDDNTIYFKATENAMKSTISASTDNGTTWTEYTSSTGGSGTTLATLNTGDKLLLKGTNATYTTILWGGYRKNKIESTARFNVYGNIMSLISGDSFSNVDTLASGNTFYDFFKETGVVNAENLIMPATTMTQYCYAGMFYNCAGLTTAPKLPATTLAEGCYESMLRGCTSLTTAPVLSATTLADGCYSNMFRDCSSLDYIKCLATDISATDCTQGWVINVATSGTFVKASSMNWPTGNDGIPDGWTVQDDPS